MKQWQYNESDINEMFGFGKKKKEGNEPDASEENAEPDASLKKEMDDIIYNLNYAVRDINSGENGLPYSKNAIVAFKEFKKRLADTPDVLSKLVQSHLDTDRVYSHKGSFELQNAKTLAKREK